MNVNRKIVQIENSINEYWKKKPYIDDLSLLTGISGLPIFYFMLYKYDKNIKNLEKIEELINHIFDSLNNNDEKIEINFCSGIAGIGYMLNMLDNTGEIKNIDFGDGLDVIDEILLDNIEYFLTYIDNIEVSNRVEQLDFLHGIFGIAYYLLERVEKGSNEEKIIALFEKLSEIVIDEYTLALSVQDTESIDVSLHKTNLGLAHGHISYILIFCKFIKKYPLNAHVTKGLIASTKTVLLFKNENTLSMFPSIAISKNTARHNIHLGWCYGDQSVSYGLYKAGVILGDNSLIEESKLVALTTLKRNTLSSALLDAKRCDAAFCHGTISVAYNHKIWYKLTGNTEFLKLYEKFKDETLFLGNNPDGLAGYFKHDGGGKLVPALGMLDGIAGIGVFFIDYLLNDDSQFDWESVFLLDY